MDFGLKSTKNKEPTVYKTLYLKCAVAERLEKIAVENKTSFNNVVVSMIESCLKEDRTDPALGEGTDGPYPEAEDV